MEAEIYAELQGTAKELLEEFSQGTHKYIGITHSGGTPDAPGEPIDVVFTYEGVSRGVVWKYLSDSNVAASNLQTTMPGTIEPDISGFIERPGGERGKITKIDRRPASGTAVAYVVVFER